MSTSFVLETWSPGVPVTLPDGLTKEQLLEFPAFDQWQSTLQDSLAKQKFHDHAFFAAPYTLRSVDVKSLFRNPKGELLFVTLEAVVRNSKNETLPGFVFLRGGAVAVLMILRPTDVRDERWVIMTEQPRIPSGSLQFMEIPAGMMDKSKNFKSKATEELWQEVGIRVKGEDLKDMTQLALCESPRESLQNAMYPSPGGCDEAIKILLWEKEMDRQQIEYLKDRLTGDRAEQEHITVRLLDYERLLDVGARDAKTMAAWSLYEYLKRTGEIV